MGSNTFDGNKLERISVKLQILKAIHNLDAFGDTTVVVGTYLRKITNLESNSQQFWFLFRSKSRWNVSP